MKPFNLLDAQNGEPVCTVDGQEVKLYAFDSPLSHAGEAQPIVGCVKNSKGIWSLASWCLDGRFATGCHNCDLRMATKTTTWYIVSFLNGTQFGTHPTDNKKKAESLVAEYRANKFTNVEITEKVVTL